MHASTLKEIRDAKSVDNPEEVSLFERARLVCAGAPHPRSAHLQDEERRALPDTEQARIRIAADRRARKLQRRGAHASQT